MNIEYVYYNSIYCYIDNVCLRRFKSDEVTDPPVTGRFFSSPAFSSPENGLTVHSATFARFYHLKCSNRTFNIILETFSTIINLKSTSSREKSFFFLLLCSLARAFPILYILHSRDTIIELDHVSG